MNLFNILYMRKTGSFLPGASPAEYLLAGCNGESQKTIDWSPVITVSDALAGPVVDFQFKITAVQSGTGDPSPTNIRPITGWTGANISVNGSTVSVSWQSEAGTVYGGVLDATTGTLTVTHTAEVYDGTDEDWRVNGARGYYLRIDFGEECDGAKELICDCLKGMIAGSAVGAPNNSIRINGTKTSILAIVDVTADFPTVSSWTSFLTQNPMTVVYPLETPITYTLTPTEIALLDGSNTLWSDTGDSKMTYKAGR